MIARKTSTRSLDAGVKVSVAVFVTLPMGRSLDQSFAVLMVLLEHHPYICDTSARAT